MKSEYPQKFHAAKFFCLETFFRGLLKKIISSSWIPSEKNLKIFFPDSETKILAVKKYLLHKTGFYICIYLHLEKRNTQEVTMHHL